MPFAENNGTRLHWQEGGEGPPILLVMGHRYSGEMWYPALPALSAKHRVIWFDNRGTGESGSSAKTNVQELAADAFAVMDAAGIARCPIYGVSMGGVIVIEMAMQHPERVSALIVGCSGILSVEKPRMPSWARVIYFFPTWLLKFLMPDRASAKAYGSAADPARVAADMTKVATDKHDKRGVLAQAVAVAEHVTTKDAVAKLTMPALVLHGDEDKLVPIAWGKELADTLPNARFVAFPGAGHNYMIAAGDKANDAVLAFLAEVDQRG
ncbi:MAG TPA: alpha/beta hydrolase [Caulobacteraceae bacterium]|jgi:pimeloyl-ACP methyl ester carboxylesterase